MTLEVKKYNPCIVAGIFFKSILAILFATVLFSSCDKSQKLVEIRGQAQGTFYSIKYLPSENSTNLDKKYFDNLFDAIDSSLSIYKPYSLVSKFNGLDSMVTNNPWFIEMIVQSDMVYNQSDGYFDPSVVHLVNAWGFGPESKEYKSEVPIDSLLEITGWNKIGFEILSDGRMKIWKKNNDVKIGFNAIAQGYSSDIIAEKLQENGIENYLIDAGGELKSKGVNQNGDVWRIGIDKPTASIHSRSIVASFPLDNSSVATSGSYRKFYEIDGVKYSHAISPKSGRPVKHTLLSVTIIGESCSLADAYATAILVMGLDKGVEFLENHKELEAYLIYSNSEGELQSFTTPKLETVLKSKELN